MVSTPDMGRAQAGQWMGPPASPARAARKERRHNLDFLFEALKIAPDETSAKAIEERIWAVWLASGGDTCNLLMTRAKVAIDAEDLDLAVKLLDVVVQLKPGFAEA